MLNENLMNEVIKHIADTYNDGYVKLYPMGAIYIYALRKKVYKGDCIRIEGENTIVGTDNPTHEITGLFGTLAGNKLQIEVRNISTNEINTIDL